MDPTRLPHQPEAPDADADFPELTADDVEEVHEGDDGDAPMDSDDEGHEHDHDHDHGHEDDDDDQMVLHDSSIAAFYEHKGESIFTIKLHPAYPNPPLCVSGGSDDTSFIWAIRQPDASLGPQAPTEVEPVQQLLPKHADSVTMVDWNADGTLVASGGMDGMINVWRKAADDWLQWEHVTTLEGGDEVQFISWHPKGNVLVAGYGDATVWMWQLPKGDVMQVFSGHEDAVTAGRFTPDGKKLLTTSTDGSLILYDPRQATPLSKLSSSDARFYSDGGFVSLAVSPDSRLAAVGSVTGQSRVVSLAAVDQGGGMSVVCALEGHQNGESIEGISFVDLLGGAAGQGNGHLITAGTDGKAIVWDLTTQKMRVECVHYDSTAAGESANEDGGALTTLVTHGLGPFFTTASSSGTLSTWDARNGKAVTKHEGFTDGVLDADVKPNGSGGWTVVGAGDEGVSLVFNA